MMNEFGMDQADGLRRLFHTAPPEVLAVLPCGAVTTRWVARQLQLRASAGVSMLVLDEWEACGNLGDCLGASPRFDLLQVIEADVRLEDCVLDVMPGLRLAQVARLARALGSERITQQRCLAQLQALQTGCDEWLLMAQPGDMQGLSPLALAAPRMVLVVDGQRMSLTTAWANLQRVAKAAPGMAFSLCHAGEYTAPAEALMNNFCKLAANRLGVQIESVGSLGEALLGQAGHAAVSTEVFIQRLLQTSRLPAVKGVDTRFAGSPTRVRLRVV